MSSSIIQRLRTWSPRQVFIVSAAFLVYVIADGTTLSFGLYVSQLIEEYSQSRADNVFRASTVAALIQSVPLLLSPLVCWCTSKFGASIASLIGCLVATTGYILPFALQFSQTFWIPTIGYGVFLSVGLAFCYVPAYLTLPKHFEADRGLATGMAVSGSGVGQVLLAVLVRAYTIEYGWRGASLITGEKIAK
jgi:MFS family permease